MEIRKISKVYIDTHYRIIMPHKINLKVYGDGPNGDPNISYLVSDGNSEIDSTDGLELIRTFKGFPAEKFGRAEEIARAHGGSYSELKSQIQTLADDTDSEER